jgi:hypothetical protein
MTFNQKEYNKQWRLENKEYVKERDKAYRLKNKEYFKEYSRVYSLKNKEYVNKKSRDWRLKNKEREKEYRLKNKERNKASHKEWRLKNREHMRKYHKVRLSDPIVRMQHNMRCGMTGALSGKQKSHSTMEIIGCSVEELFQHLESCETWESWMTRENYGKNGWDVDHITAVANWDANCPLQFILCWDKSNLQPMEHIENIKKGNK